MGLINTIANVNTSLELWAARKERKRRRRQERRSRRLRRVERNRDHDRT